MDLPRYSIIDIEEETRRNARKVNEIIKIVSKVCGIRDIFFIIMVFGFYKFKLD